MHNCREKTFKLLRQMQQEGFKADKFTFLKALNVCVSKEFLPLGKQVHARIVESGFESDVVLATSTILMYAKCGSIENARTIFDKLPERNVISWTAMITAYAHHGFNDEAFKIFEQMQREGLKPNRVTFISILDACSNPDALILGKQVHGQIVKKGIELDVVLGTAIVNMYGKCGSVKDARRMFDEMNKRNVVSWTTMIAAYARHGHTAAACELFRQMEQVGVKPNRITFISILSVCSTPETLSLGKVLHKHIVQSGIESDVVVRSALVSMYGKCGNIEDARMIFNSLAYRDVVTWTAIITACAQNCYYEDALQLFQQMQEEGVKPDKITFISILNACSSPQALTLGKQVHACIIDNGIESDIVMGNILISMYGNCGCIRESQRIFNKMTKRNVVSWTAMISVYAQHGYSEQALNLFHQMRQQGVEPNKITFISLLNICTSLAALQQGKLIHSYIIESGLKLDVDLGTALVSMYSKCGSIKCAQDIFDKMSERDQVSWNAMITAYAQYGYAKEALEFFHLMQREGMAPNNVTLVGVLCACSRAKLVDKGLYYFNSFSRYYGITPAVAVYNCVVDLLGRAGRIEEAEDFIYKMPCQPNAVTWMTLLNSCRMHGLVEQGKHAAESALNLNSQLTSAYVALLNIYAAAGKWDEVEKLRKTMVDEGIKKESSCSWIEVNNKVHFFFVNDNSHPEAPEIYAELHRLNEQMKEAGYAPTPQTQLLLHDVEDEQMGNLLLYHSEKLAIVFGLINTPCGEPLRIMRNFRICADCHNATKVACKIVEREIIVRDVNSFHQFKDGLCSCEDYW